MAVTVGQVEQLIEKIAPRSWAEDWDNPGLLVGTSAQKVDTILLSLDATMEVVEEAVSKKAGLIVTHHPILLKPLKSLRMDNQAALLPLTIFKQGISLYSAHTNLDQSELSSSLTMAKILELQEVKFLETTASAKLFKIVTFVPEDNVEKVRQALAAEGVGTAITQGEHSAFYSDCFYQSKGEGMFKALSGSDPVIGNIGELTRVPEIRLESVVEERFLARAIKALHKSHPYEEPAYDVIPLRNPGKSRGYGAIGYLKEPCSLGELWPSFLAALNNHPVIKAFPAEYNLSAVRLAGDLKKKIRKVAIANGSGSSFVSKAILNGADLYITGDLGYHGVLDSLDAGMAIGELGHFFSEIPMIQSLFTYLSQDKTMKGAKIIISESTKNPWHIGN
ncbi:MAG: Nif3-like dinuclear metal center hexameric protein [Peptococcaceae bacterium]|nr:Nif3-like dinuclear metal center hexameric protein [Peptococcaceae bacterium]